MFHEEDSKRRANGCKITHNREDGTKLGVAKCIFCAFLVNLREKKGRPQAHNNLLRRTTNMAANDNMVTCLQCKHGRFMQWMKNPIICECRLKNERLVAASRRLCPQFEASGIDRPEVTHYDHY